jgi:xanthine/CO dehydrogenase XdhC/CoxF family maturation factor
VRELKDIVAAYDLAFKQGKKSALVTLVHLEGSSYRRPGARMLVDEDGEWTGAISGGCLEGDALQKAMVVLMQGQPKLVTYDTSDEEDMQLGVQLGCSGIIHVLFEPIDASNPFNPIELIRKSFQSRHPLVLVTLFDLKNKQSSTVGTCMALDYLENSSGEILSKEIELQVKQDMSLVLNRKKSGFFEYQTSEHAIHAFVELIAPPVSLVIVGAGNDAIPLSRIADSLGWEVRIVDGRVSHARADRFASACQVLVLKPEAILENIQVDSRTVFILMTHNYNYDKNLVKHLLERELSYVGVLGPKKRMERMLNEFKEEGNEINPEKLKHVHAPTGLHIGAETPEEIAVSIVAEILAVLNNQSGGKLNEKQDVIHSRSDTSFEKRIIN